MEMDERRHTVLIVDDERYNINVLVDLLKPVYTTLVAKNGETALKRAWSSQTPDIILLDVMMPGMDGYEVCRRLKEDPRTREVPVIFITAMDTAGDEEKGLELGAVDYITKPISPKLVKLRVRNHLKLKEHSDLLRDMATLDGLTGLPNRRRFDDHLNHCWQQGLRAGTPLGLILMDIDFFKPYNDNYGHAEGDVCLKQVAKALAAAIGQSGSHVGPQQRLVARYGGEEFVCVLPGADAALLAEVGEALRSAVAALNLSHEHSQAAGHVTISLGGATKVPQAHVEPGDLVVEADERLYSAKEAGRNRMVAP